jgi:hypothetical protein
LTSRLKPHGGAGPSECKSSPDGPELRSCVLLALLLQSTSDEKKSKTGIKTPQMEVDLEYFAFGRNRHREERSDSRRAPYVPLDRHASLAMTVVAPPKRAMLIRERLKRLKGALK